MDAAHSIPSTARLRGGIPTVTGSSLLTVALTGGGLFFVQQNKIINMMTMKLGKRIHRVPISMDDETFLILSHAANYDRKDLATFIGHLVEQQVHGLKLRLPSEITGNNDCRCDSE